MKPLFLALLFVPTICFGRHFFIGIDGGISTNSIPRDKPEVSYANYAASTMTLGSSFDIKAGYTYANNIELGIGVNWASIWFQNHAVFNDSSTGYVIKNDLTTNYVIAYGATPVYLFVDKRKELKRGCLYYGMSIGYVHTSAGKSGVQMLEGSFDHITLSYREAYHDGNGFYTGATIGYERKLHGKIFVNIEASVKYLSLESKDPSFINVLYFPLTLGLKYR